MWIISAGRQTETINKAINVYYEQDIVNFDMVDNILKVIDEKGKDYLSKVECIGILDSGINSLKDWQPIFQLSNVFKDIPILIYSRYPNMTPSEEMFKDNVELSIYRQYISISDFARRLQEKHREFIQEKQEIKEETVQE